MLRPPPPAGPGASARTPCHAAIGATGYAIDPLQPAAPPGLADRVVEFVAAMRLEAGRRILATLPEREGSIAAALLTGQRGHVDAGTLETVRKAGIAHLLAISGLHLGLVAAIAFFVARTLLAAAEPPALRFSTKVWAAMAALAAAFVYLLMSGAPASAQRAFAMASVVLAAVAIGRRAISMWPVALAAVAVVVTMPHAVFSAGFQLSFAAVVALVAAYQALRNRWVKPLQDSASAHLVLYAEPPPSPPPRLPDSALARLAFYAGGIALTTVIATAATAPLALALFGRVATYGGLSANMLAVPMTALWVMPWGVTALALMPSGLEGWALAAMGWGIVSILEVAAVAGAGGGLLTVAAVPPWFPFAYGLALIWLCVWRHRWRLPVLVLIAALLAVLATARPPEPPPAGAGGKVAARMASGDMPLASFRRDGPGSSAL